MHSATSQINHTPSHSMAMAPLHHLLSFLPLFTSAIGVLLHSTAAAIPTNSTTFLLPITKDTSYFKYYTTFQLGTPPVPVHMLIDLGDPYTWLACDLGGTYNRSSSYRPIHYNTSLCLSYSGPKAAYWTCFQRPSPTCNHRQCAGWAITFPNLDARLGTLVVDVMSPLLHRLFPNNPKSLLKTTLGSFPFVCGDFHAPLRNLPRHVTGTLTLSKSPISLHSQLSSLFKIPHKFAICLPSSSASNGGVYFGGGPYILPPATTDLSRFVVTTSLVPNPHVVEEAYYKGDHTVEYYIHVTSIKIDKARVKFNQSLLNLNGQGEGGVTVSTVFPYTRLHSDIHKPFTELFALKARAMNITRVKPVKPFAACFSSKSIRYNTRTGAGLPIIDLVMEGKSAVLKGKSARWRIYGSNSMVKVAGGVVQCLAFVDGGSEVPDRGLGLAAAIVVGGKQMEDNLVEFDLEASKFGVSSSLLRFGTGCSQFKGTS